MTYKVYWTDVYGAPMAQDFTKEQLTLALNWCETLRKDGYNRFISLCSENPDSVGKQGVDVTGPDYDWKKRRV